MLTQLTTYIEQLIINMGAFAPILACLLILLESILPMLPLCTFITVNFVAFGNVLGFLISWIFTCLGCLISYLLVSKGFYWWRKNHVQGQALLDNYIEKINNVSFVSLCLIIAVPFTPAFLVNIAAGLASMPKKKFLASIVIGKIFMVYFWGFVGKSFLECFQNPILLVKIAIMLLGAYLLSVIVKRIIES